MDAPNPEDESAEGLHNASRQKGKHFKHVCPFNAFCLQVSLVKTIDLSISPSTRMVNVRGAVQEVKSCRMSDSTAQMMLQLWEKHIDVLQALSSYVFTELSTRSFERKILLTTIVGTSSSKITGLKVPDIAANSADAGLTSVTGPIHALEIRATMNCSLCGSRQENLSPQTNSTTCRSAK
ncbi:uncharacterized protein [Hoplias malabaricus]|uniref:uncharacterized protein n=1 Tax=Hoplias malabaricus TaxID=27720 RepID=UPI003462B029